MAKEPLKEGLISVVDTSHYEETAEYMEYDSARTGDMDTGSPDIFSVRYTAAASRLCTCCCCCSASCYCCC